MSGHCHYHKQQSNDVERNSCAAGEKRHDHSGDLVVFFRLEKETFPVLTSDKVTILDLKTILSSPPLVGHSLARINDDPSERSFPVTLGINFFVFGQNKMNDSSFVCWHWIKSHRLK